MSTENNIFCKGDSNRVSWKGLSRRTVRAQVKEGIEHPVGETSASSDAVAEMEWLQVMLRDMMVGDVVTGDFLLICKVT